MANQGNRQARVVPTPSASPSPITANGRTYTNPGAAGSLDLAFGDALILAANGYQFLGFVGATANRPDPSDGDFVGLLRPGGTLRFFDTSLGVWTHYDPSAATGWRNSTTLAAV